MKTNRSCRMVRNLGLALAGALVCAGLSSAQSSPYAGKFTLPFEARWGLATLPAGDYRLTMDSVNGPAHIFRGTKGVALIPSQGWSSVSAGRDALTIVRDRNGNTVRDLSLPQMGVALHYAPRKAKSGSTAAERERESAQVIAVPIEGK